MKDKLMTAAEAAALIEDGMHLGVGAGMTMNPMPVVREIIKKGTRGMTLTPVLTGGYVADLLIGAGCVETVQFPQIVLDEFGLAPNFRRKVERGELKLLETIWPGLLLGLQAGVHNLPFIPVFGFLDSDYLRIRPDLKVIKDPYTGVEYVVVPPIMPDWAVIHATKGDRNGGITTLSTRNDRLLAMASRKTIAVVEEFVEPDQVLPGLHEVYCAPAHIDVVVLAPGGAHPTGCPGRYDIDAAHMAAYVAAAKDESSFRRYLETYILAPKDHAEYLAKVGFKAHGK